MIFFKIELDWIRERSYLGITESLEAGLQKIERDLKEGGRWVNSSNCLASSVDSSLRKAFSRKILTMMVLKLMLRRTVSSLLPFFARKTSYLSAYSY